MILPLVIEQLFNALQLGLMLFLMAIGVTLAFGTMNLMNLAHGSFFMLGAFFLAEAAGRVGNMLLACILALVALAALGGVVERIVMRPLRSFGHLEQVLATYGLLLIFNELVVMIWGRDPLFVTVPQSLAGQVTLPPGIVYPAYRLAITLIAILAGLSLWLLIQRTRYGMLIRAISDDPPTAQSLGVNATALSSWVFILVVVLAGLAGVMTAPLLSVETAMGDAVLIQALVVVIIGGLGSMRGALVGALLVAFVETFGRILLPMWFGSRAGFALANMAIYVLMAAVLIWWPRGLCGRLSIR
jgi:branched-chain amino acid transport system permease protein